MYEVIKTKSPALPEIGEVLCGQEYLNRIEIPVTEIKGKTLLTLDISDISQTNLKCDLSVFEKLKYKCPWSHNQFYWMFPLGILTEHPEHYCNLRICSWKCKKVGDGHFLHFVNPNEWGEIVNAMLGHGYTHATLPCDGDRRKTLATMQLDNEDEILVACWIWFNK